MLAAVGVLLALAALLAVPLDVAFRLEGLEPFTGRVELRWLFGLVRIRVPVPGVRRPPAKAPPDASGARRARRQARGGRRTRLLAALRRPAFRERLHRLVTDLLGAVHVRRLRLRMRLGLDDPADTGRLWALVGPLGAVSHGLRGADVRIEPDFAGAVLDFDAGGRLGVIPLQVLAVAACFVVSPASMGAWRVLWSDRA